MEPGGKTPSPWPFTPQRAAEPVDYSPFQPQVDDIATVAYETALGPAAVQRQIMTALLQKPSTPVRGQERAVERPAVWYKTHRLLADPGGAVSTVESYASLLRRHFAGVLATHCVHREGYPFTSRVPYCVDPHGHPLLAVSALAQHTHNLLADARVSLSVWDDHPDDVQAAARATLLGDMELACTDAGSLYVEHFPAAAAYLQELDFTLYRLRVRDVHFIAGFANVQWLDAAGLANVPAWNIAERTQARAAVSAGNLKKLAQTDAAGPQLAAIDPQGLTLRCAQSLQRVSFPETLQSPQSVAATLEQLTG